MSPGRTDSETVGGVWWRVLALATLCLTCGGCGERGREQPVLTVSAAASLTDALTELGDAYAAQTGHAVVLNLASSGALAQQILAAPRVDLFISANSVWMDRVADAGRLLPGTRRNLLVNQLVVVANKDATWELKEPEDLTSAELPYLSIGDPGHVPAGQYARQWLMRVHTEGGASVWDALQDRIATASDVRAVVAQVESRRSGVGVVYYSDYMAHADRLRLVYRVPPDAGLEIVYPAGVLQSSRQADAAAAFLAYLESDSARAVFRRYGFEVSRTQR